MGAAIEDARNIALRHYETHHIDRLHRYRLSLHYVYQSNLFNYAIALIIISNFAMNIVEAETAPDPDSPAQVVFDNLDYGFTMVYCLELACNMFVNGRRFWFSAYSIFDFVVVLFSLLELVMAPAGQLQ